MASEEKEKGEAEEQRDPLAFYANMLDCAGELQRAIAVHLKYLEQGRQPADGGDNLRDVISTLGQIGAYWYSDPQRAVHVQFELMTGLAERVAHFWLGSPKAASGAGANGRGKDWRFRDPAWEENPYFALLKDVYLHTCEWAEGLVEEAEGADPQLRQKARVHLSQVLAAISPSNNVLTNPELMRETLRQNGKNLVRGLRMLVEDLETGKGQLKIRQSDATKFEVGRNLATTPGKVIFRNDLIELIQYAPTTETVFRRPLLIVPSWINKFYILDLTAEKSFVRWAIDQGCTVFIISWVNPGLVHAKKNFDNYMQEGIFAALKAIEQATGERRVAAAGYCVGGTLLAVALAYLAATGSDAIASATFLTTQVDFRHAGDLRALFDEAHVQALEDQMYARGFLEGSSMATAFNMLRPNDLIWSYVVNVYLKGQPPSAFDLLYWNSDSTRMAAANHSFYLRNCYLKNALTAGRMKIAGKRLDLGAITCPTYNLATREDHIAPARSVFLGAQFFGGDRTFVLAGSGHIAGVINPPAKAKYQFWTGGAPAGELEDWMARAESHSGSWWPHWMAWLSRQAPGQVPARVPGDGALPALADAPGTYVLERA